MVAATAPLRRVARIDTAMKIIEDVGGFVKGANLNKSQAGRHQAESRI